MSNLQLGMELSPDPAPGAGQFAAGSTLGFGPGTGDVPHPVTDQQGQFSAEPANLGAIVHTGNNLGATQPANSTPPGFESTAASFSRLIEQPTALIEGAPTYGPCRRS